MRSSQKTKENIKQYFHAYIKHNEFLHFHLAGIRSRIDTTACGNAIKILHSLERRFCHNFCLRSPQAEMHIKIYIPPRGNTVQNRQFRLRECNQNFSSPQAEILYLFRFMVPASGDAHKNFHSLLAGIRSRIDSSACGNAIKILHPRKRRFCNYFGAPSPRAEMHMKIYISPSREYYPAPTIPLAEMQPKYCIPASGGFVIISVHRPRERRCT